MSIGQSQFPHIWVLTGATHPRSGNERKHMNKGLEDNGISRRKKIFLLGTVFNLLRKLLSVSILALFVSLPLKM